ncbi:MAG: O-antigen ligase family protein [Candidatus Sumerlaeaceae bacterium]|jgi:O-antigen ligase
MFYKNLLNRNLASRFGLLGMMAIFLCAPYAIPAIWDRLRSLIGISGDPYYLLKPVENQTFFIEFGAVLIGVPYALWRGLVVPHRLSKSSLFWLGILFFLSQATSVALAPNAAYSFRCFLLPLSFLAFFVLVQTLDLSMRTLERIILIAVLGSTLVSAYALAQSAGYEFLPYNKLPGEELFDEALGKQKISSTFGHPNYFASYLAPILFWTLYFTLEGNFRWERYASAFAGFLAFGALVVSGARGPWLGIVGACLPYYLLLAMSPRLRRQLLFAGGVAIILLLIILFVPIPFLRFQFNLTERLLASKQISVRLYYWLIAFEMFRENFLFGVGYGNYNVLFWEYVARFQASPSGAYFQFILAEQIRGVSPGYVHNDWLQIATEGGFISFVIWVALWSSILTQGWESAKAVARRPRVHLMASTFYASFWVFAVDGCFNFPLHIPVSGALFWTLLGLWIVFRSQVDKRHMLLFEEPEVSDDAPQILAGVPRVGGPLKKARFRPARR